MPERLIDANALYRKVKTECNPYGKPTIGYEDGKKVLKLIDEQPTIEPARHGRWNYRHEDDWCYCSVCGTDAEGSDGECLETDYCPHCGAKMDGGADNA